MLLILSIHIIVAFFAIMFAQIGCKHNGPKGHLKLNHGYVVSFLILLLFLGFRESLGLDLMGYERILSSNTQQDFVFGESREIGFLLMIDALKALDADFQVFIFLTSFITLFLFYFSYRKLYYLLPFAIFVFFTDWGYTAVINTIRQGIAMMAFLNASLFIDSKEKRAGLKFITFIAIGLLFHYTILFFIPFYYLGKIKLNFTPFIMCLLGFYLIANFIVMPLYEDTIALIDKYQNYATANHVVNTKSTFGLGAIFLLLIRLAPLSIYSYVKKETPFLLKFYVLYYIGVVLYCCTYQYMLIIRITLYLQFMGMFVIAYFLYYLLVLKKQFRMYGLVYIMLTLFNYIYTFKDFLIGQVVSPNISLMFIDFYFKDAQWNM